MSTSAIGTVLDAFRAGLVLREGLTEVKVFSGPIAQEDAGLECIAFGNGGLAEIAAAMGGQKQETWQIGGEIRVQKSWDGAIETTIKAARDRALAIFAEVEAYLNDTYTGGLPDVEITAGELEQAFIPDARVCSLGFNMTVKTVKNP